MMLLWRGTCGQRRVVTNLLTPRFGASTSGGALQLASPKVWCQQQNDLVRFPQPMSASQGHLRCFSDDEKTKKSDRPLSTYCEITKHDMEHVLFSFGFERNKDLKYGELVYDRWFKVEEVDVVIRVFSSIVESSWEANGGGSSRASGEDRIRIVILRKVTGTHMLLPLRESKQNNRIKTWEKNLSKTLTESISYVEALSKCHGCDDGILTPRTTEDGKRQFLACRSCKNTADIETGPRCPQCSAAMVERSQRKDPNQKFWGCVQYPRCKGTMAINVIPDEVRTLPRSAEKLNS
jgi:hypothetical protein